MWLGGNMTKKTFQNKNGFMDIKDFVKLIHTGGIDGWMRNHKLNIHPCPPYELINDSIQCFYCVECTNHCISRVKEYKDYYKVGKIKITKEELDE